MTNTSASSASGTFDKNQQFYACESNSAIRKDIVRLRSALKAAEKVNALMQSVQFGSIDRLEIVSTIRSINVQIETRLGILAEDM